MEQIPYLVKYDSEYFDSVCRICFISGRKLSHLGAYKIMYYHLLRFSNSLKSQEFSSLDAVVVCWECKALLRKTFEFNKRVTKAADIVDTAQRVGVLATLIQPSSNLNTQVLESFNIVLIEDKDVTIKTESDAKDETQDFGLGEHVPEDITTDNYEDSFQYPDTPELPEIKVIKEDVKPVNLDIEVKKKRKKIKKRYKQTKVVNEDKNEITEKITKRIKKEKPKKEKQYTKQGLKLVKTKRDKYKAIKVEPNTKFGFKKEHMRKVPIEHTEMLKLRERRRQVTYYKNREFKCETCITGFLSKDQYVKHKKKWHDTKIKQKCDICEIHIASKDKLASHIKSHYTRYECKLCNFATNYMDKIYYHLKKHENGLLLKCCKCDERFVAYKDLANHYEKAHKYICDYCGKMFRRRNAIKGHLRARHTSREFKTEYKSRPSFIQGRSVRPQCSECNRLFLTQDRMLKHYSLMHTVGENSYCVECDKYFRNRMSYKMHIYMKHPPRKMEKKTYPCPECGKLFHCTTTRKQHIKLIHLKKSDFYCPEHDKYFFSKNGLQNHIRRVHYHMPLPKTKVCNYCGRAFSTTRILINHIRTHTGEKPFECQYCPAAFAQKTAMRSHVKHIHLKVSRQPPSCQSSNSSNLYGTMVNPQHVS